MPKTVQQKLQEDLLFDNAIIEHHFTSSFRDYDVVFDVAGPVPNPTREKYSYLAARWRYRFVYCVVANVTTRLPDEHWRNQWDDPLADTIWGMGWLDAYPGLRYVQDSATAHAWSARLGREMHEVMIETNLQTIDLVFHDVIITQLAEGDPVTDELTFLSDANAA